MLAVVATSAALIALAMPTCSTKLYMLDFVFHEPFKPILLLFRQFQFSLGLGVERRNDTHDELIKPLAGVFPANPILAGAQSGYARRACRGHEISDVCAKSVGHNKWRQVFADSENAHDAELQEVWASGGGEYSEPCGEIVGCRRMVEPYYFLGCPVWACPAWTGSVFRADARRRDWLRQYSEMFPTVEGNSSFYAIPSIAVAERWAEESAPGFQFALKFPRSISHDKSLEGCDAELSQFLAVLELLANTGRLGPSFLQLPAQFGPAGLPRLQQFLDRLPREFPYAVEARHPAFFASGDDERAFDELLRSRGIDRVLFDSRALYSAPPADPFEAESQRRKPRVPWRGTVTGKRPLVRFVGRNDVASTVPWLAEWAPIVAGWISSGLRPFFFTHAPDDALAPAMARAFHEELRRVSPALPPLPPLRGERAEPGLRQRELF